MLHDHQNTRWTTRELRTLRVVWNVKSQSDLGLSSLLRFQRFVFFLSRCPNSIQLPSESVTYANRHFPSSKGLIVPFVFLAIFAYDAFASLTSKARWSNPLLPPNLYFFGYQFNSRICDEPFDLNHATRPPVSLIRVLKRSLMPSCCV